MDDRKIRQIYFKPWKETGGNKSWAGPDFSQKSQPLDILLNDGVISAQHQANSCQLTWISAPFSLVTIYSTVNPTSPVTAKPPEKNDE